jgi:hypothetical protein
MIPNAFYGYAGNKVICACTLTDVWVDAYPWDDLFFWDIERGCSYEAVGAFNFETFKLTGTVQLVNPYVGVIVANDFFGYLIENTLCPTVVLTDLDWLYYPEYFWIKPYDFEIEDTLVHDWVCWLSFNPWLDTKSMTVRMLTYPLEPGYFEIEQAWSICSPLV